MIIFNNITINLYYQLLIKQNMIVWLATLLLGAVIIIIYHLRWRSYNKKVVYVVVLGDIGRSPRMQYHALSLARSGYKVKIIGNPGSKPHNDIIISSSIQLIHIPPAPLALKSLPSPLRFVSQVLMNSVTLFTSMLYNERPSHILVQNPPSIPSMLVCWLVSRIRGSCLIYDWHNYGYSVMSLTVDNPDHLLVKVYKWYEKLFGTFSDYNICVTESMKSDLEKNWNVRATTLHDCPSSIFKRLTSEERKLFFEKNSELFGDICDGSDNKSVVRALLLSSTSWTPDEDFGILLEALDGYNKQAIISDDLPNVLCVVTGKGPLKEHYNLLIKEKNWSKVKVMTPWLEAEDYPLLLGSADLGVCLHTSSSGLDLPMKVVDMFGCRLPVCAFHYECIGELVKENINGLTFQSSEELKNELMDLLRNFPYGCQTLNKLRSNLESTNMIGWDDNWNKHLSRMFS